MTTQLSPILAELAHREAEAKARGDALVAHQMAAVAAQHRDPSDSGAVAASLVAVHYLLTI